ncbi:MAG: cytochrome c-type biogenesis protein CcmH [Candidatus Pelagibacter sp.]|jgi:cytochrome c-type biogenesis protein CcmH|nr:MAG: cytochrome c-type biogenesis protein CcmH [Candidatus Pelagibacter sp.]
MKLKKFIFLIILSTFFYQGDLIANNNNVLVNKISKNLRCLICQGQSVYDSQSDFAISMKLLIKKKIEEGNSEKQIYEYLKNQYGEWISYDTEINQKTYLLWLFPLFLFVFGGILIFRKVFIN